MRDRQNPPAKIRSSSRETKRSFTIFSYFQYGPQNLPASFPNAIIKQMISYNDFEKVDIRVGKITKVEDFPEARKPSYKLTIDFGSEIGTKKSSAQIVDLYKKEDLFNSLILGVVNFPPKQIGPFISECLTLGVPDEQGKVVLVRPDKDSILGGKLF